MKENNLVDLEDSAFFQRLAYFLGEINAAHPFREGNGRSQREFICCLALVSGRRLDWSLVSRDAVYGASIESMHGSLEPLAAMLQAASLP